jgi:hypothetical protein
MVSVICGTNTPNYVCHVSVRHHADTCGYIQLLKFSQTIIGVYASVLVACLVSMFVSVLHVMYDDGDKCKANILLLAVLILF